MRKFIYIGKERKGDHFKNWDDFNELLSDADEVVIELMSIYYDFLDELIDYIQSCNVKVSLVISAAYITSDEIAETILKCQGHIEILFFSLNHRISAKMGGEEAYYESPNIFKVLKKAKTNNITVKTFICDNATAFLAKITIEVFHHYKDVMDLYFVVDKTYDYEGSLDRLKLFVETSAVKTGDNEYDFRGLKVTFSDVLDEKNE